MQVAGEELVTAEPALAWRFYDPLSERLPEWDYALLKAADLSLQRGELERCGGHLARGLERHASNPWLHDIAARLALAPGGTLLVVTKQPTWYVENLPRMWTDVAREEVKGYHLIEAKRP